MFDYQSSEYAAIGCMLIDEKSIPMVREVLTSSEPFQSDNCRRAFDIICTLADSRKPVDPVTVGHASGLDIQFLSECIDLAPSCSSAAYYAKTVIEGFRRRQLHEIGDKMQADSFSHDVDSNQLLEEARTALDNLAKDVGTSSVKSPFDSLQDFLQFRADVNEGKRQTMKVGFPSLDGILGGFAQGGLYIVAARPGVGKSALGIAMADMLAKGNRVLYVSLEMTAEELNARRIAAFSDAPCSFGKLLFGKTSQEEDLSVFNACAELNKRQLYISAASYMTVAELGIQARNVHADVVVVDYLGLLTGTDRRAKEYDRITEVSGDLKKLAKKLNCVVLALCQLNRESANSSGEEKLPKLSQLRSSGAIEQDADGVLLLHRPEYGQPEVKRNPIEPQQFFVDIAKNRHGRTGTAELAWYAPVNRFEDRGGKWTAKSWI